MSILGMGISLSVTQHEFLIDHVDGTRPVTRDKNEDATRNALIRMGLVRFDQPLEVTRYPKGTRLTERGRETLCAILAQYADSLRRAASAKDRAMIALLPREYGGRAYGYGASNAD